MHMTSFLDGFLLGLLQGITEWLPISSSGHLALAEHLLGFQEPLIFDILLHIASLLVIIIVFFKDILLILKGVFHRDEKMIRLVIQLAIATVPIGVIGYLFDEVIEYAFSNLIAVGICFFITGMVVFLSKFPAQKTQELSYKNTLIIGIAQAASLLPGISRSGTTNSVGFMQGVDPHQSARFSFLLAIPAISGAFILKIDEIGEIMDIAALAVGMTTAVIVGIISLSILLKILKAQKLHYFAPYCVIIGIITLIAAFL
jgi:undecaprenyl-diphosphatase